MNEIIIIGGITADIEGSPHGQLVFGDSNPGKIIMSYGGVGRNITENLARMGATVSFGSVAGDDFAGRGAVRELESLGVNIDNIRLLGEESTAVYMSILNIFGDMEVAMCNMDVLEKISTEFIDNIAEKAKNSKIIGIDTNMSEETLQYTVEKFKGVPLFLDPVSTAKAERAKKIIGSFHTIKPNRMEAEILSGMQIFSEEELNRAGDWFAEQGVERIFITLGAGGVFYQDKTQKGIIRTQNPEIVSATGAGDAFSAAILNSYVKGYDVLETARAGMAAAEIALKSKSAVNPRISWEEVKKRSIV